PLSSKVSDAVLRYINARALLRASDIRWLRRGVSQASRTSRLLGPGGPSSGPFLCCHPLKPAIANYIKTLAVSFRSVVLFAHKSPLRWRAYVPRLKISHRLFAARCVAAIIGRGRLFSRCYGPKPRTTLRC